MSDPEPFFIVGCPRSGTTLLAVLLDQHSRLCVPPETAFFDKVAPRLEGDGGQDLSEVLRGWSRLAKLGIEPQAVIRRLGGQRPAPGTVLAAILSLYATARGKSRCGEKTPQHLRHVPSILRLFPNAPVLCLQRDGRDVVLPLYSMPWWGPRSLADAVATWTWCADLAADFSRAYPAQFMLVGYEHLVGYPEDALSAITAHLGERFEPAQICPVVPSGVVLPRSMDWKGEALGPRKLAALAVA